VTILGSGPAAWAAAAALAPHGVRVTLVAPDPDRDWTNTYGTWVDQIDLSVLALVSNTDFWAKVFDTVQVIGDRNQVAGRSYGRFDNVALASALRASAEAGTFTVRTATATEITHDKAGTTVELTKGAPLRATLVLDGTGTRSPFITRETRTEPEAFQVAYGIIADFEKPPLPENTCTLMDWRGPNRPIPSFAYTLPIGDHWLVEETALASRPALSFDELERRLHDRLRADGLAVTRIHDVERVSFPMDVPLPHRTQRTIGLGAAASLVHPATGYSVAASLRSAPRIAATIAEYLGSANTDLDRVSRAVWQTQWSDDRVKARRLESYGLERVLTMDQRDIRSFFDSFFQLSPKIAATYLGGEAGSADMASVMWKVFRNAGPRLQRRLATGNPLTLARSLLR
jgi:lycopene cyclase-like protein